MTAPAAPAPLHTEDWHAGRRTGVGGSDIPILAGLSPYDLGPHDLYLDKRGESEPRESTPAMEVGLVIEDAIAVLYTRRTGKQVTRANRLVRHPQYPWAIGNLDRKVRGERRLLEIKNRRYMGRDGLPADVECQVQWYMGVTRYPVADVAILVGGSDLRIIEVQADEHYFRDLLVIAGDFWRRVEDGRPPDLDGSAAAARYLASRYPWHQGEDLVPATPDVDAMAAELRQARADATEALARVDTTENAIKAVLGEAPGVQGAGYRITWRRSADYQRTDWKAVAGAFRGALVALGGEAAGKHADDYAAEHTTTVEGTRRFVAHWDGENDL